MYITKPGLFAQHTGSQMLGGETCSRERVYSQGSQVRGRENKSQIHLPECEGVRGICGIKLRYGEHAEK